MGGCWGPSLGNGSQQESKSTKTGRMWCLAAMVRKVSMRCWKPFGSCSQSRLCRKTRMVFIPMPSAQPSSRSMVTGSKVSACHISSSLIAVEGRKLAPTGQGCRPYHALACASVQRSCAWSVGISVRVNATTASQRKDFDKVRFMAAPQSTIRNILVYRLKACRDNGPHQLLPPVIKGQHNQQCEADGGSQCHGQQSEEQREARPLGRLVGLLAAGAGQGTLGFTHL